MKFGAVVFIALAAACGGSSKPPATVANTAGTGVTPAADLTDAQFKSQVVAYAAKTGRFVGSWGTVMLDGVHPSRYATLPTNDYDLLGAYIFELAPSSFVAVVWNSDGRATPFERGDGVPIDPDALPWTASPAKAIDHASGHHHGGESLTFGERDGKLVLFSYNYDDDETDPNSEHLKEAFLVDGACKPTCPELTAHKMNDSSLTPGTPAASIDLLTEPKPENLQ